MHKNFIAITLSLSCLSLHIFAMEISGIIDRATKHSVLLHMGATGKTNLHYAAEMGEIETMQKLLDKNAPIDAQDHEGNTPLHTTIIGKQKDAALLLVKYYADFTIRNNDGRNSVNLLFNHIELRPQGKKSAYQFFTPIHAAILCKRHESYIPRRNRPQTIKTCLAQ